MSLISTIITNTSPPNFVLRRRYLPPSKLPDSSPRLSPLFAPLPKCRIPSYTLIRNHAPVTCFAVSTVDQTISSTSSDEAAADAGEGHIQGTRRWSAQDVRMAGGVVAMHALCLMAPFYFTWEAFWVGFGLYMVTGLFGISVSYHRMLTHRSFKLPKWLEYTFAYCGAQAFQGNPIDWVSTHRHHHMYSDTDKDLHSPLKGFWFSHMTWMFDQNSIFHKKGGQTNVGDLQRQSFYRFLEKTYMLHPLGLALLLYSLGGLPFVIWGMGVRTVWGYHITWGLNSAAHLWGNQAWNTRDLSRNNWLMALITFGEGWHNNHHAFEYSAKFGLEWWQFDLGWYVIWFLRAVGLATDVKLPSELQKQTLALTPDH